MNTPALLNDLAARKIIALDGAMGSLIQSFNLVEADFRGARFADHPLELKGCNDLLCLTRPDIIASIHKQYLSAGADITKTCSFSANALSLADYGLQNFAYEINKAAASLAKSVADQFSSPEKPRFVAGSVGPTSKSASISPDADDPSARSVNWDELESAYYEQARGLLDGGADILLAETIFDTLNAKAALAAFMRLQEERGIETPLMISATISGLSGRLLAGQTVEAFCASVAHCKPWSIGLNCSFGADALLPHIRKIADFAPCLVSVHPNAGLPNLSGAYGDSPETMAHALEQYMKEGLINIAGGCCGSTPAHIEAIAEKASHYAPRKPSPKTPRFYLAGLDLLTVQEGDELKKIGERTNVAGSRKFLRLIKEENYAAAVETAREMAENGAEIIDICMDDALLDAESVMPRFLNHALSDPAVAAVPLMPDSSNWKAIEAGLKCIQGKALVNSVSLKEGETALIRKARTARKYGAALVAMLFDEQGQAADFERKIAVAGRIYALLVQNGFPPEDIVFDPNVLSIATGIPEHDRYALDFIRACEWIRENCPHAHISGGISNLSFSFRGNESVRNALHSVFLRHAVKAGLSLAIVNPASLVPYEKLDPALRSAAETLILCEKRVDGVDPAEKLLAIALESSPISQESLSKDDKKEKSAEDRVRDAVLTGADAHISADIIELVEKDKKTALEIMENTLMSAMEEVGARFAEGKFFLPQVIRSARVMKKASSALEPFFSKGTEADKNEKGKNAKIVLATVKGDVHDIGKNIVATVLTCNGCQIIDLGVMVPAEKIIESAITEKADMVGLSGLITPSLDEMIKTAQAMSESGLSIPLLIGGAAASLAHTALRIAPIYSAPVVYTRDASQAASAVRALLSETARQAFLQNLEESYQKAIESEKAKSARYSRAIISLEQARKNRFSTPASIPPPRREGLIVLTDYPLERVSPYINWESFFSVWRIKGKEGEKIERERLKSEAAALLDRIQKEKILSLRAVLGIFRAEVENEDVSVFTEDGGKGKFCFVRNRYLQKAGASNPCVSDFLIEDKNGESRLGIFALSAGFGVEEEKARLTRENDEFGAILLASLTNALAEAFAEELHSRVRKEFWGYAPDENLSPEDAIAGKYQGIRPAFGYPILPNNEDKRTAFTLLRAEEKIGLTITESSMMIPEASVCGLYIAHPLAYYFESAPPPQK